jgi:4-carboxymuconolactone decarboxylase
MNRDAFKSIRPVVLGVVLTLGSSTSVARATPEQNQVSNQASSNDLSGIAPEFTKLTQDLLFGDIWKRPGLSQRDKSLITVTVLATLNRPEQIDFHLNKALENGLTQEELVAAMTHTAFYAGWPSAHSGLLHLKTVLEKRKAQKK